MNIDGALGEVPKKSSKRVCRGRTGVVKCPLRTVTSDPFLLERIEEGVRFYTSLSVWASRFLLFLVLRQLDADEPLQEFGTTFFRQIITCCAYEDLGTRAKFPQSMLEARAEFLKHVPAEFSFSPRGTGYGWRYLLVEDRGPGRANDDGGQELHDHSAVSDFAAVVQVAAKEGQDFGALGTRL
jgi:hypothetical protein